MANDKCQQSRATRKQPPSRYSELMAAWSRLDEPSRTKFFATLLHAALAKTAATDELALWLAVLDDWHRDMTAGVIADLDRMDDDGCDQQ